MYETAKKHDQMETAKPYLAGMLITTVIGFFFGWMFFLLPVVALYIIYAVYKKKMSELGIRVIQKGKKRRKK
jgi:hypothetical protein